VLPARVFSFVYILIDEGFWELLTPARANFWKFNGKTNVPATILTAALEDNAKAVR
jgi:hypothetical protein